VIKALVRQLLKRCGYRISSLRQTPSAFLTEDNLLKLDFDFVVARHLLNIKDTDDFFFIQVGAFDGVQADPIRKFILRHHWQGVLIEPQKKAFAALKQNYADQPQLTFKNVAISDHNEVRTLYTVAEGQVPEWCQGLASFDREVILKHKEQVPGLADLVETEQISCVTFQELFDELKIDKVDLLQVDAEGYDAEIVSMFPFDLVRPSIIHFERKHLSFGALEKCLNLLLQYNYKISNDGAEDLVAYRGSLLGESELSTSEV
jgi:FkbM family methyltransferase